MGGLSQRENRSGRRGRLEIEGREEEAQRNQRTRGGWGKGLHDEQSLHCLTSAGIQPRARPTNGGVEGGSGGVRVPLFRPLRLSHFPYPAFTHTHAHTHKTVTA